MSVMRLRHAFDDGLSYALMQDAQRASQGLLPLAEHDSSPTERAQRAAVLVAGRAESGPTEADWKMLMYVAASALVALNAAAEVKVHTGDEDDYRDPSCRGCGLTIGHEPGCRA